MINWIFWAYLLMLVPFLLLAVGYTFAKPRLWRKEPLGRALVILLWTLSLTLINTVVGRLLEDDHVVRDVLRLLVVIGGFISGWYLFVTWIKLRAKGAPRRREQARRARAQRLAGRSAGSR